MQGNNAVRKQGKHAQALQDDSTNVSMVQAIRTWEQKANEFRNSKRQAKVLHDPRQLFANEISGEHADYIMIAHYVMIIQSAELSHAGRYQWLPLCCSRPLATRLRECFSVC